MERQKIFWVVLAVSVFVVIVLVAGVLLLRQHPAAPVTAPSVSTLSGNGTQVYEYQKEPAPGSATTGTGKPSDQQTLHFYIGEGSGPSAQQTATQTAPTQGTGTAEPAPSTVAPETTVTPPAAQSTPSLAAKQTVAAAPKTPAAKAPQAHPSQRANQYWIQTGSYKSQTKAEDLVATLAGKGLTGRVFSTTANNDTFYRVRIGPYASKAEAEKFLGIVKQLQGLEASFIAMVPAKKNPLN